MERDTVRRKNSEERRLSRSQDRMGRGWRRLTVVEDGVMEGEAESILTEEIATRLPGLGVRDGDVATGLHILKGSDDEVRGRRGMEAPGSEADGAEGGGAGGGDAAQHPDLI